MSSQNVHEEKLSAGVFKALATKVHQNIPVRGREDLMKWLLDNWSSKMNPLNNILDLFNKPIQLFWEEFYLEHFNLERNFDDVRIPLYEKDKCYMPIIVPVALEFNKLLNVYKKTLLSLSKPITIFNNIDYVTDKSNRPLRKFDETYCFWMTRNDSAYKTFIEAYSEIAQFAPSLYDLILMDIYHIYYEEAATSLYDMRNHVGPNYDFVFYSSSAKEDLKQNDRLIKPYIYSGTEKLFIDADRLIRIEEGMNIEKLKY